ncbi:hypothetical protein [Stackebrandtia soli]|uniref:hypothetical protein n=1 Tax=Stackebrandtia soli TaxID=1892856 RepID=UPI0039E7BD5B
MDSPDHSYQDVGARVGELQAEGVFERARCLLEVLAERRFVVDDAARARVEGCADPDVMGEWLTRAATAASMEEVFEEWESCWTLRVRRRVRPGCGR